MLQRLDLHSNSSLDPSNVAALKSLVGALVMAMSTAFGAEGAVFQTAAAELQSGVLSAYINERLIWRQCLQDR
jgi:hypothetical protein